MAAKKSEKLTKSSLMKELDLTLQDLNLLKSVLQANPHPTKVELEDYQKRYKEIMQSKG
jgi:hypothetical protein